MMLSLRIVFGMFDRACYNFVGRKVMILHKHADCALPLMRYPKINSSHAIISVAVLLCNYLRDRVCR